MTRASAAEAVVGAVRSSSSAASASGRCQLPVKRRPGVGDAALPPARASRHRANSGDEVGGLSVGFASRDPSGSRRRGRGPPSHMSAATSVPVWSDTRLASRRAQPRRHVGDAPDRCEARAPRLGGVRRHGHVGRFLDDGRLDVVRSRAMNANIVPHEPLKVQSRCAGRRPSPRASFSSRSST